MSQNHQGILLFNEWIEAMEYLNPVDFKAVVMAITRYQLYDEEPPEFKGKAAMVSKIIFPCLEKRKQLSENGRKGGLKRVENSRIQEILQRKNSF